MKTGKDQLIILILVAVGALGSFLIGKLSKKKPIYIDFPIKQIEDAKQRH